MRVAVALVVFGLIGLFLFVAVRGGLQALQLI